MHLLISKPLHIGTMTFHIQYFCIVQELFIVHTWADTEMLTCQGRESIPTERNKIALTLAQITSVMM